MIIVNAVIANKAADDKISSSVNGSVPKNKFFKAFIFRIG